MMKYKVASFGLICLFSLSSFSSSLGEVYNPVDAAELTEEVVDCKLKGHKVSDGKNLISLNECIEVVRNSAKVHAHSVDFLNNASSDAWGVENLIVYEREETGEDKKQILISGNESKLSHIDVLRLNEQSKEIYILQKEKKLFSVFSTKYSGNIAPLRSFSNDDLSDGVSFTADQVNRKLYLLRNNPWKIISYSLEANSAGRSIASNAMEQDKFELSYGKDIEVSDILFHNDSASIVLLIKSDAYYLRTLKVDNNGFISSGDTTKDYKLIESRDFSRLRWTGKDQKELRVMDNSGEVVIVDITMLDFSK